jgi:putative inorganic carbon (HCO3(-)) transporter
MAGLMAILVLAPTQISLELIRNQAGGLALSLGTGEHSHVTVAHLSLVDPVVWLTFALWLAGQLYTGAWRAWKADKLILPVLLVVLTALSLVKTPNLVKSANKILQQAEYFIAAYLLFITALSEPKGFRKLLNVFLGVASVVVLIGFAQYWMPSVEPFKVRSTFLNSNVFGGFLSLALPLMFGLFLGETDWRRRAWLLVVILAGATAVLSGGSFLGLALAFGCVALGRGWKPFLAYAVLLFLLAFLVLPHLPRGNLEVQKESVELFNADGDMGRRYPEWQAAVEMIREHPLLGVGSGCYQEKIGTFYGTIPIVPGSAAQADTQNLYLVLAASIGLPGLVAFLGLLLGAGAAAARKAVLAADTRSNGLFLGVAGSVAAFAVNSIWSPLLVRGIGIPLVFILALALAREDENSG